MTAKAIITVHNVTKCFGSVTAVESVNLDVRENEFFALLGPSGCGKTTLLRVIAGFERPDTGRILLDDWDVTAVRPNKRPINLMFQSYALFPHMSVERNIAYGLEMEGKAKGEIAARVAAMMDMTKLAALAGRKPDQLSGGQRQRVALARALVKRPRVLLLDEPLGALDKKLREEMELELKRMQDEIGITFIVVTHDQDEALVMADRIAVMHDGRVVQVGTPHDLYEAPTTRFVASFIGRMNFFDGTLADEGVLVDGHGVLRGHVGAKAKRGGRATLAVRPERVAVGRDRGDMAHNAVAGTIADVAYHGQDIVVHAAVDGTETVLMARLPVRGLADEPWHTGDRIWCLWDPADSRVLTD